MPPRAKGVLGSDSTEDIKALADCGALLHSMWDEASSSMWNCSQELLAANGSEDSVSGLGRRADVVSHEAISGPPAREIKGLPEGGVRE